MILAIILCIVLAPIFIIIEASKMWNKGGVNMRKYICHCDNGHDYYEFEFCSEYRAKSKKNIEDAKSEHFKRWRIYPYKIIDIYLY